MTTADIINWRLINQQIAETKFKKPQEIVNWMIAMQAQDFAMAKWAIGLRLPGSRDVDIEKAFNDGHILRTHLMRPTWHFVTPADIRWMLALTAPRVNAVNAYWYRKFGLDNKIFKRSNNILAKTLEGGKQLTRATLKSALEYYKINADGLRLSYLMMRAELDGVICSGARQGKQFTYALLDERVPGILTFNREQALAELIKRYFTSRGPATLQDFVYWSGLTIKDAKTGFALLKSNLVTGEFEERKYIFNSVRSNINSGSQTTFLMPDYDEYGMSYKNRSALNSNSKPDVIDPYTHWIVINGKIEGTWERTIKKEFIEIDTVIFAPLNKTKKQAVTNAVNRYSSFFGKSNFQRKNKISIK